MDIVQNEAGHYCWRDGTRGTQPFWMGCDIHWNDSYIVPKLPGFSSVKCLVSRIDDGM